MSCLVSCCICLILSVVARPGFCGFCGFWSFARVLRRASLALTSDGVGHHKLQSPDAFHFFDLLKPWLCRDQVKLGHSLSGARFTQTRHLYQIKLVKLTGPFGPRISMPSAVDILQFFRGQLFQNPTLPNTSFSGKVVVITGGNTGLGLECAKHL